MMDKSPSEGFTLEELRFEYDWMFEFQSRMAEHIRNDPDVHSLAGYVSKLEAENAKLKEELESVGTAAYLYGRSDLKIENAKLRELITDVHEALCADKAGMFHKLTLTSMEDDMRELGIEVTP